MSIVLALDASGAGLSVAVLLAALLPAAWLLLRGMRTLPLRVKQCSANALHLAEHLQRHPAIADVLYPGTYVYSYDIRASVAGSFQTMPSNAYAFYFPEVFGRSDGELFTIK